MNSLRVLNLPTLLLLLTAACGEVRLSSEDIEPGPTITVLQTPVAAQSDPLPTSTATLVTTPTQQAQPPQTIGNYDRVIRLGHGLMEQVACASDGQVLAVTSSALIIVRDEVEMPAEVRPMESQSVESAALSPDSNTLALGLTDGSVRLWQVSDRGDWHIERVIMPEQGIVRSSLVSYATLLRTLEAHTDRVQSVAFAPDGRNLATGSADHAVYLWQVSDGALLRLLGGHTAPVWSVAFSPDGQILASGGEDDTVRLWRVSDGALLTTQGHPGGVLSIAFSPDGQLLASGSWDGAVRLWQFADGALSLLRTLQGHADSILSVAFSPDGYTLASGSLDNTVHLWRVSDGMPLRILEGHENGVYGVAFCSDGRGLVSGGGDSTIRRWGLDR